MFFDGTKAQHFTHKRKIQVCFLRDIDDSRHLNFQFGERLDFDPWRTAGMASNQVSSGLFFAAKRLANRTQVIW